MIGCNVVPSLRDNQVSLALFVDNLTLHMLLLQLASLFPEHIRPPLSGKSSCKNTLKKNCE